MILQDRRRMAYASVAPEFKKVVDRDYYGTPPEYIKMAKTVMGRIELDPASCEEANQLFVNADRYYSKSDNGLSLSWRTNALWLNPPYSSRGSFEFAKKFYEEASRIKQAIVLVNSATGTRAFRYLFDSCDAICFCNRRIQFIQTNGIISQNSNSKEQLFFYKGRRHAKFAEVFGDIGRIVRTK